MDFDFEPEDAYDVAKAIVAFLATALDKAGVDIPVDPGVVDTLVTSVVTAVVVWATRNRQPI